MRNDLTKARSDIEWSFILCAISDTKRAVTEHGGLPSSVFSNERLGKFWDLLKKHGDAITASNEISPTFYAEIISVTSNLTVVTTRIDEYSKMLWRGLYSSDMLTQARKMIEAAMKLDANACYEIALEASKVPPLDNIIIDSLGTISDGYKEQLDRPIKGIPSGFAKLDKLIGYLQNGTLTLLAARPGVGKTTFVAQVARQIAISGYNVALFSLEMSKERLWERMVSSMVEIPVIEIRRRSISKDDMVRIKNESDRLAEQCSRYLTIIDDCYTPSTIISTCFKLSPDIIIIDHLDEMIKPRGVEENMWRSEYLKEIRDFSKKHPFAILCAAQLNRELEKREDKVPKLSDLRWDGGIEQVIDICLMLHRDDYFDTAGSNLTKVSSELWIRKNRDGPNNIKIPLLYNLRSQWYTDDVDQSFISTK